VREIQLLLSESRDLEPPAITTMGIHGAKQPVLGRLTWQAVTVNEIREENVSGPYPGARSARLAGHKAGSTSTSGSPPKTVHRAAGLFHRVRLGRRHARDHRADVPDGEVRPIWSVTAAWAIRSRSVARSAGTSPGSRPVRPGAPGGRRFRSCR